MASTWPWHWLGNFGRPVSWFVFWSNVAAYWSVFVTCLQPVNWQYCLPVQTWLFPAIRERIRDGHPYEVKHGLKQSKERSNGLGRLDDR